MRAVLFRAVLSMLERHTPAPLVWMELQILQNTTARGFGVPAKRLRHIRIGKALEEYAAFTAECARSQTADRRRLYREAYRTGSALCRVTGFRDSADQEQLVFYLYRNIRIAMTGQLPGEIRVSSCWFSQLYTPQQCALMSFVDSGIIAGICGGGKLVFTERITEGCGHCKACFHER